VKATYLGISDVNVDASEVAQRPLAVAGLVEVAPDRLRVVEVVQEAVDVEDGVVDGVALEAGRRPACQAVRDLVVELVARGTALTACHLRTVCLHSPTHRPTGGDKLAFHDADTDTVKMTGHGTRG